VVGFDGKEDWQLRPFSAQKSPMARALISMPLTWKPCSRSHSISRLLPHSGTSMFAPG